MSMRCTGLLVAAALSLALPARAGTRNELSLGVTGLQHFSYSRPSVPIVLLEAAYLRTMAGEGGWSGVQLGGGLRAGWAATRTLPVEVFVRAQVGARLGVWAPAVGPEVGVSGFNRLSRPLLLLGQQTEYEDARLGPVYVAFTANPLRFQLGRFTLSALQLRVGTHFPAPSSAIRVQLGLVSVGGGW